MSRTCPKCEMLSASNADFCEHCGYRVVVEAMITKPWGRSRRQYVFNPGLSRSAK